jgi:lysophospholipase L1-like esterase
MKRLLCASVAVLVLAAAGQGSAQTLPAVAWPAPLPAESIPPPLLKGAIKIILVGDSTMQVRSGWGGAFCSDHVTSFVACVNLGRGGRSSGSYIAEGSWDIALSEMSAPGFTATYVLIQMGHNDGGYVPGRVVTGRSTDIHVQFPANMRRYVEEARAHGAIPILVTPLIRRQFVDGRLQNDLAPWAEVVRQVAAETHAPLVDLNAASFDAVQALGPLMASRFAQSQPSPVLSEALFTGTTLDKSVGAPPAAPAPAPVPGSVPGSEPIPASVAGPVVNGPAPVEPVGYSRQTFDYTHLGPEGADFFSALMVRELVTAAPALRAYLYP